MMALAKKLGMLVVASALLTACGPPATPAERVAEEKARVEMLQGQFHACDKNDGVADIDNFGCYKGNCRGVVVTCNDGMKKEFTR